MGNVGSRPDDHDPATLYIRDQNRFSLAALTVTDAHGAVVLNVTPNAVPATRLVAKREQGDEVPVEYIQDPDFPPANGPVFLLRLSNEDELHFHFSFIIRQSSGGAPTAAATAAASTTTGAAALPSSTTTAVPPPTSATATATATAPTVNNGVASSLPEVADTVIHGLTFAHASNARELDTLVTREFHANPNLQNNSNVAHVGTFSTAGTPAVQFDWTWDWKPPKLAEDKGGGWRNCCSFLDYDQRTNRLNTIATFTFWVQHGLGKRLQQQHQQPLASPAASLAPPPFELNVPQQRSRIVSEQSVLSRTSETESEQGGGTTLPVPPSPPPPQPAELAESLLPPGSSSQSSTSKQLPQTPATAPPVKVDVACQRPGEDVCAVDDGPVFRATMKSLEQKTGTMRTKMKKVLKKAEAAHQAQVASNEAMSGFLGALTDAASTNANAIQPALEHYFEKIAREILQYEQQSTRGLQKQVIDPLSKVYTNDIKQADAKKKDFDDESRDYYAFVGRYLGQRQDSLKEKKRAESDSKYQTKRRNFELKRFDYSSFMQDLHGGRKEQEVLSHLTRYADTQAQGYLRTARRIEDMVPEFEALKHEVAQADKEYQFQRTEREEKRRTLEKSTKMYVEPETATNPGPPPSQPLPPTPANSSSAATASTTTTTASNVNTTNTGASTLGPGHAADSDMGRADSTSSQLKAMISNASTTSHNTASTAAAGGAHTPGTTLAGSAAGSLSSAQNLYLASRDLESRDPAGLAGALGGGGGAADQADQRQQKKEGLLWALSRPGSHIDPKGINKQAWHKFWIVLDQGKLSEYSNWKQKLDLHMEPIDLRMASVREARNAERRFCFEVITPQFKRIYQATSEEDMSNWINAINNALQSAVEGRINQTVVLPPSPEPDGPRRRDIGSVLTGKSSSHSGHHGPPPAASQASNTNNNNNNNVNRRTTVGARPSYVRSDSHSYEVNPSKLLQIIRDADQSNAFCADCGSSSKVEWVSINLGIVLCIECSGIHRSLGTHISKVRSLTLDFNSFSNDIVEILLQIGNRVSNMVWEARLDSPDLKPTPQSTREQRLKFITAKYNDRAYVQPLSSTLSRFSTADETLLASIKKNDIQGVLHGLALRANPNVSDRSRGTHAVFLALAAADPAAPTSSTSPKPAKPGPPPPAPSSSAPTSTTSASSATSASTKEIPFAIAELLVQNGARIPNNWPAIPLSAAAMLYVNQRTGRVNDEHSSSTSSAGGTNSYGSPSRTSKTTSSAIDSVKASASASRGGSAGDRLSALPTIRGGGDGSGSGGGGNMGVDSKEREKLQKRGSAGARLAGRVASTLGS